MEYESHDLNTVQIMALCWKREKRGKPFISDLPKYDLKQHGEEKAVRYEGQ